MKIIIFLVVVCLCTQGLSAQTTYFSQNFDSSNNLADYYKTPGPSKNQFDDIKAAGTTTIGIHNNKLRIVKSLPTTESRVGVSRQTAFEGAPEDGPQFLKFTVEVTVSGNPAADVNDGFAFFFLSTTNTGATAPSATTRHSYMAIDPRKTEGAFRIRVNGKSSGNLTGTQTIIAYINNSGTSTGYMAPDGLPATLDDDMLDIWVQDAATGAVKLLLTQVPAMTPANTLKNFKLASNPNFAATLDVDNLSFVEEVRIPVKKVQSIASVAPITVPEKTDFNKIPFSTTVNVVYDNGTSEVREVTYSQKDVYNMHRLGTYEFTGTLVPKRGTINPDQITVTASVTVKYGIEITNAFTPNGDGKNDTWIVPDLQKYTNVSIEVYDRDGKRLFHTTDPNVGWDGKNQKGEIISGSYFYIINLPPLSLTKKGVLTLIK